jgi:CrcB protein
MAALAGLVALVALGSALGGAARFLVSGLVARALGETFPWGTMVVNVTGAFALGCLAELAPSPTGLGRPEVWLLAGTGFLGSYTTVSSLSLQTLALARDGEWPRAAGNLLLSLALGLGAVLAGIAAARLLAGGAA